MKDPFSSARLTYRAYHESDYALIRKNNLDGSNNALASPRLLRPRAGGSTDDVVKYIQDALLGVIICVKDEENRGSEKNPAFEPGVLEGRARDGNENLSDEQAQAKKDVGPPPPPPPPPAAAELVGHGRAIGFIGLSHANAHRMHHRDARLGIEIFADDQNGGYGSEALDWILNWGFNICGLHRVGLEVFAFNERAMAVYRRAGFVVEGRRREAMWFDGRFWDDVIMGVLEGEWRVLKGGGVKLLE